jgi:hypothetical protein
MESGAGRWRMCDVGGVSVCANYGKSDEEERKKMMMKSSCHLSEIQWKCK